jgi:hypothetical protein
MAICNIRKECSSSGEIVVVIGQSMFWPESDKEGKIVSTEADLQTYTRILYLDIPAHVVVQRRQTDTHRS